jgi:hypothetical protein
MSHYSMFDLEQLPDEAQALICSLASTPSCPAHALLAQVTKTWHAIATQHWQTDGAGVALQLSCTSSSTTEQKRREVRRLAGLATWLRRHGPSVNNLDIHIHLQEEQQAVLGRSNAITKILEALAAAGQQPGGLRLQQLRLPALGSTPPSTISDALDVCRQLKALHLDYSFAAVTTDLLPYLSGDICAALQCLTHLTSLHLNVASFELGYEPVHLDKLFTHLPSSTQELVLDFIRNHGCDFILHTSSMRHLTALQQLVLPDFLRISSSEREENSVEEKEQEDEQQGDANLEPLTALTSLVFGSALLPKGSKLLALPSLVSLTAGFAKPPCLRQLASRTTLCNLTCTLTAYAAPARTGALGQVTQLTGLWLGVPAGKGVKEQAAQVASAGAVGSLTGLRSLALQPEVLERVPLAALTALTCVTIDVNCRGPQQVAGPERIKQLVSKLAPAKGRLQVVKVLGTDTSQHDLWSDAVAGALGDVWVAFW